MGFSGIYSQMKFGRDRFWHLVKPGIVDTEFGTVKYTLDGVTAFRPDQVCLNQVVPLGTWVFDRQDVLEEIYEIVDRRMDNFPHPLFALEIVPGVTHLDPRGDGDPDASLVLLNCYYKLDGR